MEKYAKYTTLCTNLNTPNNVAAEKPQRISSRKNNNKYNRNKNYKYAT